jgi:hypothetical protein
VRRERLTRAAGPVWTMLEGLVGYWKGDVQKLEPCQNFYSVIGRS